MNIIAAITTSHRQTARLPEGRETRLLNGVCSTLGSKQRVWYYPDTPENRQALRGFSLSAKWSKHGTTRLAELEAAWPKDTL